MRENGAARDGALAAEVKRVHRSFPTGVTVVTTCVDGEPYGLVVNAFSSISLDPPLVLVCVARTTSTYPYLFDSEHFAVNILAADQADLAARFARSGGNKFDGLGWRSGENGAPVLERIAAGFELHAETRLPAYTHTIFVGRVTRAHAGDHPPLVYLDGRFFDGSSLEPAG